MSVSGTVVQIRVVSQPQTVVHQVSDGLSINAAVTSAPVIKAKLGNAKPVLYDGDGETISIASGVVSAITGYVGAVATNLTTGADVYRHVDDVTAGMVTANDESKSRATGDILVWNQAVPEWQRASISDLTIPGVEPGGSTGQVLAKASSDDYDTEWVDNNVPDLPEGKFFIGSSTSTTTSAYTLPTSDGTANQVLTTDGSGTVSFTTLTASDLVSDTSPQLGGNLDVQTFNLFTSSTNGDIQFTPNGTGSINLDGTVKFKRFTSAPSAFEGGMYADNNDNLYFGVS